MLAKISNRYFCVQLQSTRSVMMFIRENIVNRLISLEETNGGDVVSKSEYYQKGLKKSLSDCGDVMQFDLGI
jgi:hypothetical protein